MTSVTDSIEIRSSGIAGATPATLDLVRARILRARAPRVSPVVDEAEKFAFGPGASVVTVRLASGDEGSTLARPPIDQGNRTLVEHPRRGPFAMTYVNPADDPRKMH
jgi:hypothetical protein